MNESKIQVNDIVRYNGITVEYVGLENGKDYIISEVTPFGDVKLHGCSLNDNISLKPEQFTLIYRHNPAPLHELDAIANNPATSEVVTFDNQDKSRIRKSLSDLNELSKKFLAKESKARRKMNFSSKAGSAVVYYKNGNTFHITNLASVEVGTVDVDGPCVSVRRKYEKDGIYFEQIANIPVRIFDKIVYKPNEKQVIDDEVIIGFDEEKGKLVYPLTYVTTHLILDR